VRGSPRERIADFFERAGEVEREIRALSGVRAWRRATAAYLLGAMGSQLAERPLRAALGDPNRDVRAAAARSLGRLGAAGAVRPLVYSLIRSDIPRTVAAEALLGIGPAALAPLRGLLVHPEAEVKTVAAELVGILGDAADAAALHDLLTDTSAEVRAKAARALGRLGAQEAAAGLRAALDDRIPFVRAAAANAIGMIGDHDAGERLLALAREDRFEAAQAAARALARVDGAALLAAALDPANGQHVAEAASVLEVRA
jgi:HEAT repeat protein